MAGRRLLCSLLSPFPLVPEILIFPFPSPPSPRLVKTENSPPLCSPTPWLLTFFPRFLFFTRCFSPPQGARFAGALLVWRFFAFENYDSGESPFFFFPSKRFCFLPRFFVRHLFFFSCFPWNKIPCPSNSRVLSCGLFAAFQLC